MVDDRDDCTNNEYRHHVGHRCRAAPPRWPLGYRAPNWTPAAALKPP